ncbi:MAG: hypothetical protein AAGJ50_07830, partial [Pseudomonadota bacterium]
MSKRVNKELKPLKLSVTEKETVRILYLAQYAPYPAQTTATIDLVFPAQSKYHFDLYQTLCSLDLDLTPMSDPGAALNVISDYGYIFSVQNSAPFRNSEVLISAAAECFGIPYLGAPPNVRALAEDKYLANRFVGSLGVRTPRSEIVREQAQLKSEPPFDGPFIVKPRFGVNSELLTDDCIQDNWADIAQPWRRLKEAGVESIVEEFIPGGNVGAPFVEALGASRTGFLQEVPVGGRNVLTRDH